MSKGHWFAWVAIVGVVGCGDASPVEMEEERPAPDACAPAVCLPSQCGAVPDGCGGTLSCGACIEPECARGAFDGWMTIRSDADAQKYEGYTSAVGLDVGPLAAVKSLAPLHCLTRVTSGVDVRSALGLTSLAGLDNLTTVGALDIAENRDLTAIRLPRLREVGGVDIRENPALRTMLLGDGTATVARDLIVAYNPLLEEIGGAASFSRIGRDLMLDGSPRLASLAALGSVTEIGGGLYLGNLGVRDLTAFHGLAHLGETPSYLGAELIIADNAALVSLEGLGPTELHLTSLGVHRNPRLTALTGLKAVRDLNLILSITENASLISLDGLQNVNSVGAQLVVSDNDKLQRLTGLNVKLSADIILKENAVLSNLDSLLAIQEFDGPQLYIENNPTLATCAARKLVARAWEVAQRDTFSVRVFGNDDAGVCP